MELTSAIATDLIEMIPFAEDDIETVRLIKTAIDHFWLSFDRGEFTRSSEFKYAATKALVALKDCKVLAAWIPQIKQLP